MANISYEALYSCYVDMCNQKEECEAAIYEMKEKMEVLLCENAKLRKQLQDIERGARRVILYNISLLCMYVLTFTLTVICHVFSVILSFLSRRRRDVAIASRHVAITSQHMSRPHSFGF